MSEFSLYRLASSDPTHESRSDGCAEILRSEIILACFDAGRIGRHGVVELPEAGRGR